MGVRKRKNALQHFADALKVKINRIVTGRIIYNMEIEVSENKEKKRFEVSLEGKLALIDYIRAEDKMYLTHTEVPSEMEGKGIASSMVKQVFQQIRDENLKLVPLCPFVASYLKRHPEWKDILASGYNV